MRRCFSPGPQSPGTLQQMCGQWGLLLLPAVRHTLLSDLLQALPVFRAASIPAVQSRDSGRLLDRLDLDTQVLHKTDYCNPYAGPVVCCAKPGLFAGLRDSLTAKKDLTVLLPTWLPYLYCSCAREGFATCGAAAARRWAFGAQAVECGARRYGRAEIQQLLGGKWVVFAGDSIARFLYAALLRAAGSPGKPSECGCEQRALLGIWVGMLVVGLLRACRRKEPAGTAAASQTAEHYGEPRLARFYAQTRAADFPACPTYLLL
jgi:hypothetical protein